MLEQRSKKSRIIGIGLIGLALILLFLFNQIESFALYQDNFWVYLPFIVIGLVSQVFWIWMLVDCIKRDFEHKTLWIILIILMGVFGATAYYFSIKNPQYRDQLV